MNALLIAGVKARRIPGFEALYAALVDGRIWAFPRAWRGRSHAGHFLVAEIARFGYRRVTLHADGKRTRFLLHRLIALAWLPNPRNLPFVNHLNGQKDDNQPGNLEWCTQGDNERHAWRTGLKKDTPERRAIRAETMRRVNARGLAGKGARR